MAVVGDGSVVVVGVVSSQVSGRDREDDEREDPSDEQTGPDPRYNHASTVYSRQILHDLPIDTSKQNNNTIGRVFHQC